MRGMKTEMKQNQMKKIISGLAAVLTLSFGGGAVLAEEADVFYSEEELTTFTSGDYTYSLMYSADENDDSVACCIESYSGTDQDVVIPAELDGYDVVALGDRAFMENYTATSITLPATLVGTGLYTFYACTNVQNYYVAEGSEYYTSEDGVLYADDGTYLVAYPLGRNPSDLVIDEHVVDIGNSVFAASQSLQSVTLPEGLKYIGVWAFSECSGLTSITIPDGVSALEDFCFSSCTQLREIRLPATLTTIGAGAFAYCGNITEFLIPSGCTEIGQAAFAATGLTELTVPSSVTTIGFSAMGWDVSDVTGDLVMIDDFVIYGLAGSEAQYYATDSDNGNQFTFEALTADEIYERIGTGQGGAGVEPTFPESEQGEPSTVVIGTDAISGDGSQTNNSQKTIAWIVGLVGVSAVAGVGIALGLRKRKQS